ncbi:MAG: hypothetical protein HGA19_02950 [Oscillochloris sp.]|nr:hypothetical protein [Oscillochloris sp.]
MKISYKREGGIAYFPGLNKIINIDTSTLPTEQANWLEELCTAAKVFERPPAPPPKSTAADFYTYILTFQMEQRQRTLRLYDPVEDQDLRALLDFLEQQRAK